MNWIVSKHRSVVGTSFVSPDMINVVIDRCLFIIFFFFLVHHTKPMSMNEQEEGGWWWSQLTPLAEGSGMVREIYEARGCVSEQWHPLMLAFIESGGSSFRVLFCHYLLNQMFLTAAGADLSLNSDGLLWQGFSAPLVCAQLAIIYWIRCSLRWACSGHHSPETSYAAEGREVALFSTDPAG